MSFNFSLSMSLSLNLAPLGLLGREPTNQTHLGGGTNRVSAGPLAPPATPPSIRQSHQAHLSAPPRTRQGRDVSPHTPQAPRRNRHASRDHVLNTSSVVDEDLIPETRLSRAKDRERLANILRFTTPSGHSAAIRSKQDKQPPRLFDSPQPSTIRSSTSTDPFVVVATPVSSHNSGSDLASSLQSLRVRNLTAYFKEVDSAAASHVSSAPSSSGSQEEETEEACQGEDVVERQGDDDEVTSSASQPPSSSRSQEGSTNEPSPDDDDKAVEEQSEDGKVVSSMSPSSPSPHTASDKEEQSVENISTSRVAPLPPPTSHSEEPVTESVDSVSNSRASPSTPSTPLPPPPSAASEGEEQSAESDSPWDEVSGYEAGDEDSLAGESRSVAEEGQAQGEEIAPVSYRMEDMDADEWDC